jgi:hypothetical protein
VYDAVIVALPPPAPSPVLPPPAFVPPAPLLPPAPRRSSFWPIVTALLVVCMLLALGGATAAVITLRGGSAPSDAVTSWVDMRPEVRDAALRALLGRLEGAVKAKDKAAFLAEVDQSDPALVKREQLLYDNLTKIPFAEFRYELDPWRSDLQRFLSAQLRQKYHQAAHVGAVTIRYRIAGIDAKPVTTPWLPIFVFHSGRWEIAGQAAADKNLPYGANGQAWDAAGPIVVQRSKRVVAVLSADDASRGTYLLDLAEQGLDRLAKTRPDGWDGKVFVTAVQDTRIFDTYFADSPDRVARVAAIAVPYYDRVPDWASGEPVYAATRVVFNPQELSAQPDELAHDLTHEFTHAAMGPVTTGYTPRWLVEGFAEYAAFNGTDVPKGFISRDLGGLDVSKGLPSDDDFYSESRNYVGAWLACRYIASQYGQAKLVALYAAFLHESDQDVAVKAVLGVDFSALESAWEHYVKGLEG